MPELEPAEWGLARLWNSSVPQLWRETVVEGLGAFKDSKPVKLMLASFAASYKKTDSFKEKGFYSQPITKSQQGFAEVQAFLSANVFAADSCINDINVEGEAASMLKGVLAARWLWSSDPKKRFEVPARNGFASLRVQLSGTAKLFIIIPSKLGVFFGEGVDNVIEFMTKISANDLENVVKAGAIYKATVPAWNVLYIPTGAITLEDQSDGVLCYSLRVPILPITEDALASYSHFTKLSEHNMKPGVPKMQEVCKLLATALGK